MALRLLRHRRATALTSLIATTLYRPLPSPMSPTLPPTATTISPLQWLLGSTGTTNASPLLRMMSTKSGREYKLYKEGDEITEDTILFEGCDYNHWLITVDFPKDNKPPPEEMVATYESICAKGLNISIEEAKKRIYACSTTTYEGFQAVMTEEESEKFKDIDGVVFVLPDSYIDPVNKEYGGDKYENGVITHRPPPIQYKRGGRERNRNQPGFNRAGPMPNQQGPQYSQRGPMQGGGSHYGPQSNYQPQQNYGPQPNYQPQQNFGPPGQEGRMPVNNREFAPGGSTNYQSNAPGPMPSHQGNYNRGQQQIRFPPEQRNFPQGDQRDYGPPGQRDHRENNVNYSPTHAGNYGQGGNASYGQRQPGDGQRFSPMEQRNMQGEPGNNASMGQAGWSEQGRY